MTLLEGLQAYLTAVAAEERAGLQHDAARADLQAATQALANLCEDCPPTVVPTGNDVAYLLESEETAGGLPWVEVTKVDWTRGNE